MRTRRLELPRDLTPTRPSTWRVYQFRHVRWSDLAGARTQDPLLKREMLYQLSYQVCGCDLAGVRTQDPLLKREMLYQLSYQVKILRCKYRRILTIIQRLNYPKFATCNTLKYGNFFF